MESLFNTDYFRQIKRNISYVGKSQYEFFCAIKEKHTITEAFWFALDRLKNYTGKELKKFCNMLGDTTQHIELRHSLCTESLKEYPFSNPICWGAFVLIGGV